MVSTGPPIIGVSQSIERVRELIKQVADTGLNTVITGQTGTGKEIIAQNLYQRSPRLGKPFVKINCAALPEGLLESELYGYERGAFTGAEKRKKGKFELAHGGVLFLDEIGDMSISLQSKLLHVLQTGEFAPLGAEKDVKTDTWIIAATNHELEQDIINKQFREDLYYRLNIIKIFIPPLRNRPEDIPHLVDYYIGEYTSQFSSNHLTAPSDRIIEKLMEFHWPGNVRQLQNIIKRNLVVGDWDEIIEELFKSKINFPENPTVETSTPAAPSMAKSYSGFEKDGFPDLDSFSLKDIKRKALNKAEKEAISYVLGKTGWNRSNAAKILKISYKTLLYKISDLKILPPPQFNR